MIDGSARVFSPGRWHQRAACLRLDIYLAPLERFTVGLPTDQVLWFGRWSRPAGRRGALGPTSSCRSDEGTVRAREEHRAVRPDLVHGPSDLLNVGRRSEQDWVVQHDRAVARPVSLF